MRRPTDIAAHGPKQRVRSRAAPGSGTVQVLGALVIVALLIGVFAPHIFSRREGPEARVGHQHAVVAEARDTVCRTNLDQIRRLVAQVRSEAGKPPRGLADLGLSDDAVRCPSGSEPYAYVPSTGEVHCLHPGHEAY